ncbi:unnamed protein product [Alopecurus aequalis]
MAITKAAHMRLLLLAAILMAVASAQARGDSMPPLPAMAPSPAGGGQCPPDKVAELGDCFESNRLGGIRLPTTLDGWKSCCRRIRHQVGLVRPGGSGTARLVRADGFVRGVTEYTISNKADPKQILLQRGPMECLCSAFSNSGDRARSPLDIAGDVNTVFSVCGQPQLPDLACSIIQSVTV